MSKTVFILGAGASAAAGAPVMASFLDVAHDLWKMGHIRQVDEDFSAVYKGISDLQRVHSKSELDITNIESVFAAFEMAKLFGRFADYEPAQIDSLISGIRILIARTIEQKLVFPVSNNNLMVPRPYGEFAGLIHFLQDDAKPKQSVSIVTFNYDIAIDYALHNRVLQVDYGLSDKPKRGVIPLLKLHGSLNWGHCADCDVVVPWTMPRFFKESSLSIGPGTKAVIFATGARLAELTHEECGKPVEPDPVLVPPTWNKGEHHRVIARVWARAAKELSEAENIFVIGYSLPPSDEFFKYLYALGTVGETTLKRIWVVNPDESVKARFERLLGPQATRRFAFHNIKFAQALDLIRKEFTWE